MTKLNATISTKKGLTYADNQPDVLIQILGERAMTKRNVVLVGDSTRTFIE